jgi:hypothetical protein
MMKAKTLMKLLEMHDPNAQVYMYYTETSDSKIMIRASVDDNGVRLIMGDEAE